MGRGRVRACVIHCQDTIRGCSRLCCEVELKLGADPFLVSIWFKRCETRSARNDSFFSFTFLGWNCIKGLENWNFFPLTNLCTCCTKLKRISTKRISRLYFSLFREQRRSQFHFAVIDLRSSSREAGPLERYKSLSARQVTSATSSCIRSPFQRLDISIPVE